MILEVNFQCSRNTTFRSWPNLADNAHIDHYHIRPGAVLQHALVVVALVIVYFTKNIRTDAGIAGACTHADANFDRSLDDSGHFGKVGGDGV